MNDPTHVRLKPDLLKGVRQNAGFLGCQSPSSHGARGLFLGLRCALGLAVVGTVCCKGSARAWWLGFAAFGWLSVRASFDLDNAFEQKLPAQMLLGAVGPRLFGTSDFIMPPSPFDDGRHFVVWHCLWALLAAVFGGVLAITILGAMTERIEKRSRCSDDRAFWAELPAGAGGVLVCGTWRWRLPFRSVQRC